MKKFYILALILWTVFSIPAAKAQAPQISAQQQYDMALDQWVDRLAHDESGSRQSLIVVDTDGNLAYSCLQFHYGTFVSYSRKLGLKGEIGSCADQKQLAKTMIRDDYSNWTNWYNSVKHKTAGMPPLPVK